MESLERQLQISEEKPPKRVSSKRKHKDGGCDLEKKRRCTAFVRTRDAGQYHSTVEWHNLVKGCMIGQKPCGKKPPVYLRASHFEVIKGPVSGYDQAFNTDCMTRLAREVLGLENCIPDVRVIVSSDGKIGLRSPLIGYPGPDSGERVVSKNDARGLCKLHECTDNWMEAMVDPMDVLKIVVAKNLVGSSDNNTSNILIELHTGRVYGLDLGGQRKHALQMTTSSFQWAFSKKISSGVSQQMDDLVNLYAVEMTGWLERLKREDTKQRWQQIIAEYPTPVTVPDLCEGVDLFYNFFSEHCSKIKRLAAV